MYLNMDSPLINFKLVRAEKIYIDKSLLIVPLNDLIGRNSRYVCITRPRRFGKTINANMLGAYYTKGCDSHTLFDGLAIAGTSVFEKHLNKHNVIYIDLSLMPQFCTSYKEYILNIYENLMDDIRELKPHLAGKKFSSLSDILKASGESYVFILDEWDSIFYEDYIGEKDKKSFLRFLKGLLKDQPYVELAYMTGVLPIAKYSSGSELNMFDEYHFMNDNVFEDYFGFQEEEVKGLCEKIKSVSFEELKWWYDGYQMYTGKSLFNPRSVSKALTRGICLNYWTETGPMNEIADCIEHNVDEVREDIVKLVAGIPIYVKLTGYSVSELQLITREEILSAMVVYGFLSYHDGCLKIPNHELMEKYQNVLARKSMGKVKDIVDRSKEMLEATLSCSEEKVASILEYVHDKEIPFLNYNDENSLSCVITLCYLSARDEYWIEREEKSGKGYCDYLFIPRRINLPAIILELKVGRSAEIALAQIKEKNYIQKVEKYRDILLVGINYDDKKHHNCKIEKLNTLLF